jgi:hypothetical protein
MKSLTYHWRGSFATTTTGSSGLRMLLVYDKQVNAALPNVLQIVQSDDINGFMNLSNSRRFVVIADERINCVATGGNQSWNVSGFRALNLETEYNETNGGTIADITTGAVYAIFWQDGNILTASPDSQAKFRIRFEDF